jgi:hypothetical protein
MTHLIHPAIARAQAAEIALAADRRHAAPARRSGGIPATGRPTTLRRFAFELLHRGTAAQAG